MSSSKSKRASSMLNKFGIGSNKKVQLNDPNSPEKWVHTAKEIKEGTVAYLAKYLGCIEVSKAKGVDTVKEAIKKLKVKWQVKKSEAGNKGSKLPRVEINISIDSLKVIDCKTRLMICGRPLHRVSYCADDHSEKKIFAFIAKDQQTKKHNCFVFLCDKLAAELTMTLGQAFQMAYRRYVETEKADIKKTKDIISLEKEIEKMKSENIHLKEKLEGKEPVLTIPTTSGGELPIDDSSAAMSNGNPDTSSMFFHGSDDGDSPPTTPRDIHTLTNPFPPSMLSPRANENASSTFQAYFPPSNDASTPTAIAADPFDPFADTTTVPTTSNNLPQNIDFFNAFNNSSNSNVRQTNDDLFGDLNGADVSIFDTSTTVDSSNSRANGTDFQYEYHDFEEFGTSPHAGDFVPKIDPFADTPDWESVASEEVGGGGSSVSSAPHNPFSTTSGSGQLTTNQNVDLFKSNKSNDPFASNFNDPFAAANNNTNTDDLFNTMTKHQSRDLFGATNDVTASQDIFNTNNADPFFLSNTPTNNTLDLFNMQSDSSGINPFFTPTTSTLRSETTDDSHDLFSDYLTKVSSRNVSEQQQQQQHKNDNLFATSSFEDGMQQMNLNDESAINQQNKSTPTARPRPSGLCGAGQSIPAPPTKQDIKKTTSPVTPTAPSPTGAPNAQFNRLKQAPTTTKHASLPSNSTATSVMSKGMLPNVRVTKKVETIDSGLLRSRTRSQNTAKPLSIHNASKSLEDLVGLDGTGKLEHPSTQPSNPNPFFSPAVSPPPMSPDNQDHFFKEVHSPDKNINKPSFPTAMKSYAAFEGTF